MCPYSQDRRSQYQRLAIKGSKKKEEEEVQLGTAKKTIIKAYRRALQSAKGVP
jgi:hypothetical protein